MNVWSVSILMATLWGCSTPETYLCTYDVRGMDMEEDEEEVSGSVDYEICSTDDLTSFGVASMNTLMVAVDCSAIEGFEQLEDVTCDAAVCVPLETECDNNGDATRVE